jgi:hypothetical protein
MGPERVAVGQARSGDERTQVVLPCTDVAFSSLFLFSSSSTSSPPLGETRTYLLWPTTDQSR